MTQQEAILAAGAKWLQQYDKVKRLERQLAAAKAKEDELYKSMQEAKASQPAH